jgi:DNA/RNA-binding domain of Phe-tRNA-synthetase-like protein
MSSAAPAEPQEGWLSSEVEQELPGVRLLHCETAVGRSGTVTGDSPPDIEARLRELSDSVRGARAMGIRREPVPAAYRVFFRQVGIDPDVQRTPIEAAVVERMVRGGFPTAGMLEDVRLIAMLDTGVPVWALDSTGLEGPLGIRVSRDGETLGTGEGSPPLPEGRLVVADSNSAVAILFGDLAAVHEPRARTRRVTLFAVQVPGVPGLYAEETLWSCVNALQGA